jgi:hypothetical protein
MREQVGRDRLAAYPEYAALAFLAVSLAIKLGVDLGGILPNT